MVWEQDRGQRRQVSPRNYAAWKRLTGAFADVNAWSGRSVNIATDDRPENVNASIATPGFLPMLGYGHPLALGRTFSAEEALPGHDNVVILTWQLWHDRFGGDPRIVGRQIRLDDKPYTVVGVLGKGPADRTQSKVWLPLAFTDGDLQADNQNLNVMGRLADGVSVGEANARVAALSAAIERDRSQKREGWTVSVEAFRNNFVRDTTKRGIWSASAPCCSCCSSLAPTSPTCFWRVAPRVSVSWRFVPPSARRPPRLRVSCWLRASSWR